MFLKTLTKSWKSTPTPAQVQPAIVGGAPDLQYSLDKLGPNNSVPDRITAAESVLSSISQYSVSSIPEIWFKAVDMLEQTNSPECRRAGLKLTIECIDKDQDLEITKMSFYKSIISTSNVQDFDLDLKAMIVLTKNGSDVERFFFGQNNFPKVIDNWFRVLFSNTQKIRMGSTDIASPWGTSTEQNFFSFLEFVKIVYEKNSYLFAPEDTINFISRVCQTCKKTSSVKDISYCFDIIETIQKASTIPTVILSDLLEILCGTFLTVDACNKQASNIILNLDDSELKAHTFSILLNIIKYETEARHIVRGAIRAVQILLERAAGSTEPDYQYSVLDVMDAYGQAARLDSLALVYELLSCIHDIFNNHKIRKQLATYEILDIYTKSPFSVLYDISIGDTFNMLKPKSVWSETCTPEIIGLEIADTKLKGNDKYVRMILDEWKKITSVICQLYESDDFDGSNDAIINCFVDISPFIDKKCAILVVDHFRKSQYCNPLDPDWIENLTVLTQKFFAFASVENTPISMWSTTVRLKVVDLVYDVYELAKETKDEDTLKTLLSLVFENVTNEPDLNVLSYLIEKSVEISGSSLLPVMDYLSDSFLRFFDNPAILSTDTHCSGISSISSSYVNLPTTSHTIASHQSSQVASSTNVGMPSLCPNDQRRRLVSIGFCQIFVRTFRTSAEKAQSAYDRIISIIKKTSNNDPVSFLEAARLLVRIRATTEGFIYLTEPTNMDGLSASVGRNLNFTDPSTADKASMMWYYPENVSYLQSSDFDSPSPTLKRRSQIANRDPLTCDVEIDVRKHFDEILRIIENGAHWEAYSFVWAHFGPQLSNIELFQPAGSSISRLRHTIVLQINNIDKLPRVEFPKGVTRNDLLVALVRTISSLIPYRHIFTKNECDDIVQALSNGILGEKTAVTCIHGLMVCCHEFPLSIKKYLGQIFTRFQAKITSIHTTPHILEFLLSLSRLPTLVDNFTQDEYKRVFGMSFAYLNSPLNLSIKPIGSSSATPDDVASSVMSPLLSPPSTLGQSQVNIIDTTIKQLSQYILSLAYNVVATWFLTLRMENRKYLARYITRNLIRAGGSSEVIDAQGMAFIDLISRFAFSDIDLTIQTTINYPSNSYPNRVCRQWIYGASIVTIDSDPQSGESFIVVRRPTGTSMFNMKPDGNMLPSWLEENLSSRNNDKDSEQANQSGLRHDPLTVLTPNYVMLQLMYPLDIETAVKPTPLTNDPVVNRAIGAFDRIPVVDFHKVGILYIGPGQQHEQEILSNQAGSPRYRRFLKRLGNLVRLKGNKRIYTGGLDTNNDVDGEYAYIWSDKVTQMIFHTTTMMPHTNPNDTSYSSKKRHIGNDFINIYFDESELPFQFDVIKSQFNFINIVITPVSINFSKTAKFVFDEDVTRSSDPEGKESGTSRPLPNDRIQERTFFKVRAHCKPEVPTLFAGSHLKILSEDSVADFVRNLALISSKFAAIWNSYGNYKSNWQLRYDQIETLKQKAVDLSAAERKKANAAKQAQILADNSLQQNNKGHNKTDSVDKNPTSGALPEGGLDISSSFLSQLQTTATGPVGFGSTPGPGDSTDSNETQRETHRFVMEESDEEEFPVLRSLEFTSFTQ